MHCYNRDFQDLAVLPPYNTLCAQVVRVGNPPQVITTSIEVTYVFTDNTHSVGKSNFWSYAQPLFGLSAPLPTNIGLTGKGLAGMMEVSGDHFTAVGIPLTEFSDSEPTTRRPFQLATITVSDGGPHAWWTSDGVRGPSFVDTLRGPYGAPLASNEAEYYYPNGQGARLEWYHDHTLGLTRLNAYGGVASGYVIYDDYELSLVANNNLPGPLDPRTIYLVFQDKIFVSSNIAATDPTWPIVMSNSRPGDLWYAHVYETARWALGPGGAPPNPSAIPEFFGDTILVNGTVYPTLEVEQRQYRFRLLNACNARFLNPRLVYAQGNIFPATYASS